MTEREIFLEALEIATPEARAAYLQVACGGDGALRRRVDELLKEHFSTDRLLAGPAIETDDVPAAAFEAPIREGPGQRIGRYKLLEKIGEGGFGEVWMADQCEPVKRRVAVKIIKPGMDSRQIVSRFEGERQALALMDHPNIARILDAGTTENGRPYFVMELVRGVRITEYCEQNQLPVLERLKLFIVVCQAIQHAHQKGIIHRDIKPSNILVTLHDGVPAPKVIDFGIAKATQQSLTDETVFTQFQQFLGTPAYISPEQAEMSGLDIDTRTDIYSLGVLLYELLIGKTPFDSRELLASGLDGMRRIIREKVPLRPSTALARQRISPLPGVPRLASIDRDLDWIVIKCLEKDRSRRYATANGLAADLQRHLASEPIHARPPSAAYRFGKAWQRHRVAFTAGAAIVVALVLGTAISSWQAVLATHAKRDALVARAKAEAAQNEAEGARQAETSIRLEAEHQLYAAKMNLARHAWERNDFGQIRQLLRESATYSERGFEWFYWQRQAHLDLRTLRGHRKRIWCAAYSMDGRRVVTASDDCTARIWDAITGQELLTLEGHGGWVRGAAFSPDGQRVVTAGKDYAARLWDATTGQKLLDLYGHRDAVRSVVFSADGKWILTASQDQTAKVWDALTGRNVLTLRGHSNWVVSANFSPDGRQIITGGSDKTARLWDAQDGRELVTFKGHSGVLRSVSFSPDGLRVLSAGQDGTARIWRVTGGEPLLILAGHSGVVFSANFSPDGQRIITAGQDRIAKIWDAATGRELSALKGHGSEICSAFFSPDGQRLLTGSRDGTAMIWNTTDNPGPRVLGGQGSRVVSVACSPDNQSIVTGDEDGLVKVWIVTTGQPTLTLRGHSAAVQALAFSPDGRLLASGSEDESVKLWQLNTGREVLSLNAHSGLISSVAFSRDGLKLVTLGSAGKVIVWEVPRGRHLLTLRRSQEPAYSAKFSPDGRRLVIGSEEGAKVCDSESGQELFTIGNPNVSVRSVDFSPDGKWLITAGEDLTAKVWEAASGAYHSALTGHSATVLSAIFSPDGRRILTASADGTVRLWDVTGSELLMLAEHNANSAPLAFAPDGMSIVTGSHDGTALVWKSATSAEVDDWTKQEADGDPFRAGLQGKETADVGGHASPPSPGVGGIKQWLVLAPILLSGSDSMAELDREQISMEAGLHPRAGESIRFEGVDRFWEAIESENSWINFNNLVGKVVPHSAAYAICYLVSPSDQSGLVLHIISDDHARIYLNGRLVYRSRPDRLNLFEETAAGRIELRAGVNRLVFKVLNETGGWQGSIRLTDGSGLLVQGLRVSLDPDGKDRAR